ETLIRTLRKRRTRCFDGRQIEFGPQSVLSSARLDLHWVRGITIPFTSKMTANVGPGRLFSGFKSNNFLLRLSKKSSSGRRQSLRNVACDCGNYCENCLLEVCCRRHGC